MFSSGLCLLTPPPQQQHISNRPRSAINVFQSKTVSFISLLWPPRLLSVRMTDELTFVCHVSADLRLRFLLYSVSGQSVLISHDTHIQRLNVFQVCSGQSVLVSQDTHIQRLNVFQVCSGQSVLVSHDTHIQRLNVFQVCSGQSVLVSHDTHIQRLNVFQVCSGQSVLVSHDTHIQRLNVFQVCSVKPDPRRHPARCPTVTPPPFTQLHSSYGGSCGHRGWSAATEWTLQ